MLVKLLKNGAIAPSRSHVTDAGVDVCACLDGPQLTIIPGGRVNVPTGIAVSVSPGQYVRIAPRSGLALSSGIDVLGGVVDSGYRGEIGVILVNHGRSSYRVQDGQKIAQLIVERCYLGDVSIVDTLPPSARQEAGFGSTG